MKDVIILMEQTSELEVQDLSGELPSDLHLIEYKVGEEFRVDGVRAYKMSDIFDFYHDWLSEESEDFSIVSIKRGYGSIKPRLFNYQQEKS